MCPGASADPRKNSPGFLVFVWTEKGGVNNTTSEQKNFKWYREHLPFPFITVCRSCYFKQEDGTLILDNLNAVSWCDGCQSQLKAITSEMNQSTGAINKIASCKHSASLTLVKQVCNTCPVFCLIKSISKSVTNVNLSAFGLRTLLRCEFSKLKEEGKLNLKSLKESALLEFLPCYPSIISNAAPTEAVACGFIDNVMIDMGTYSFPDYNSILRTCKSPLTRDMERIVEEKFNELFVEQTTFGILFDSFMSSMGIIPDRNYLGFNVSRTSEAESWQ